MALPLQSDMANGPAGTARRDMNTALFFNASKCSGSVMLNRAPDNNLFTQPETSDCCESVTVGGINSRWTECLVAYFSRNQAKRRDGGCGSLAEIALIAGYGFGDTHDGGALLNG